MSEKMSTKEFREIALAQSYLGMLPDAPAYFGDFFAVIAFVEGERTRVDLRYIDVCWDAGEKLGFVRQSEDVLVQLDQNMKALGLIAPGSASQFELSRLLRQSKYFVYMLIWSTRALIDCLSVHLNVLWSLGYSGTKTWLGSSAFRDALRSKRPSLASELDELQEWFSTADRYRLFSIHREALPVLPNADPGSTTDWTLSLPKDPEGCVRRSINGQMGELRPVLDLVREWRAAADRMTELVIRDTIAAIQAGEAPIKFRVPEAP